MQQCILVFFPDLTLANGRPGSVPIIFVNSLLCWLWLKTFLMDVYANNVALSRDTSNFHWNIYDLNSTLLQCMVGGIIIPGRRFHHLYQLAKATGITWIRCHSVISRPFWQSKSVLRNIVITYSINYSLIRYVDFGNGQSKKMY